MKQKILIVLFLVIMTIPLGSCRSFSELEDRYMVLGAAVDYDKNMYVVTVEIVNYDDSSIGKVVSKYYTGSGISVFDAVRNIIKSSGRKLLWSHTMVFIISKDIAASNIHPIIDWINRERETDYSILLVISREKTAKEILECKSTKSSIPSMVISEMLKSSDVLPKYPKINMQEFAFDLSSPGMEPIAPAIKIVVEDGEKKFQTEGTAVFLGGTMLGYLNDYESMNMLLVRNKVKSGLVYLDKNITNLSTALVLEFVNSSSKIVPKVVNGKVTVEIDVKAKLEIAETEEDIDLSKAESVKKLKKTCDSYLEKQITNTIKTVQEKYKSDIFGLGYKISTSLPSQWKGLKSNWSNNFSNLEFLVKVDTEITGGGLVNKPLNEE